MKRIFKMAAFMLALGALTAGFTACGDDNDKNEQTGGEGAVAEEMKFNDLKATANADGSITIGGSITTNTKLKEFCLYNEDGSVAYNFLKDNDQIKEKNEVLADDGTSSKEKQFTLPVASKKLPVAIYKLTIKTRKNAAVAETIGAKFTVTIGSSKNTTIGSYLCLAEAAEGKNEGVYMMAAAKENPAKIDVIAKSSDDGYDVIGIQRASKAKAAGISDGAGKTALFDDKGNTIEDDSHVLVGTVITDGPEDACIAKVTVTPNAGDASSATIEGVVIKNSATLPLDVTAFSFTK